VDRDKTADGLDGGRRRHRIVKHVGGTQNNARRPRPQQAIDARKHAAAAKVAAVRKAVKALGRTGAPVTRVGVAQLAEVSRSFTYENDAADSIIAEAQTRTQARAEGRIEQRTAQEEASWRERALNAEDEIRNLRRELATQRLLVGDLLGRCESRMVPGSSTIGTVSAIRTSTFSPSGTSCYVNETSSNVDSRAHERTFPASRSVAYRRCSRTGREESSNPTGMERQIDWAELAEQADILARRGAGGATTTNEGSDQVRRAHQVVHSRRQHPK